MFVCLQDTGNVPMSGVRTKTAVRYLDLEGKGADTNTVYELMLGTPSMDVLRQYLL